MNYIIYIAPVFGAWRKLMDNGSLFKYIGGRQCAILGLGVSNLPLAKVIAKAGLPLTVYDKAEVSKLGADAQELEKSGVRFVADGSFEDVKGELIFRSPGIRPDRITADGGAEITSEMELFLHLTLAKTFAITGSDGKTTSTTLTGLILTEECKRTGHGNTFVGGNIGTPLLTQCEKMTADDNAVLELSSFQLMGIRHTPRYVAITNVSPNHLDWHVDMDEYVCAKKNIIGENTERLVTNADCECTLNIAKEYASRKKLEIILFSSKKHSFEEIFEGFAENDNARAIFVDGGCICVSDRNSKTPLLSVTEIKVPGQHNVENFMTAMAITYGTVDSSVYLSVARSFSGVEHRLELVRELDGVAYYNSSIDSSPTRTAAALSAMTGRSIVLICGGYDKKIPYAPLASAIVEHGGVHTVSLTGATGKLIGEEIEKYRELTGKGKNITLAYNADFIDAVSFARESAATGDAVLLSPASASFDAFKNFAERGEVFKKTVRAF